jgi:hypothetical protein
MCPIVELALAPCQWRDTVAQGLPEGHWNCARLSLPARQVEKIAGIKGRPPKAVPAACSPAVCKAGCDVAA